jgi:putative oxidoreductase
MAEPRSNLSTATEVVYSLLRIVAAWVYLQHGAQKLFGVLGGMGGPGKTVQLMSEFGAAGVIEFFGGTLILIGLFTRVAAFITSGEMAVAYFQMHAPRNLIFTTLNHGELPALFAFIFLYISLTGPGRYSLDALIARARGKSVETL